jgi:hypothetical protein
MAHWLFTIFVFLHGAVHMVYPSIAQGWIPAPESGDTTGQSWLLARPLGEAAARNIGAFLFIATTLLFVVAAVGLALRQPWSVSWLAASAIVSSLALVALWDGKFAALAEKGAIGLAINIALLIGLYVFRYPAF